MNFKTGEIADICNAEIYGSRGKEVSHILTDSRSLVYPDKSIFFAINGVQYDGHRFINELIKAGVKAFVVSEMPDSISDEIVFIKVNNSIEALQKTAELHREKYDTPVIGITGSNGKTIVKEWISQILTPHFDISKSPKSYNSQIGVPLSVLTLSEKNNFAVFEAGISQPGEMCNLEKIIKPAIGVLTSFGEAHQENFGSYKEKLLEKFKLFENCEKVILPFDDQLIKKEWENSEYSGKVKTVSWSLDNTQADYKVNVYRSRKSSKIIISGESKIKNEFILHYTDKASVNNAITVIITLLAANIDKEIIYDGINKLQPVAMRLEVKEGINNCILINDSYNSDTDSLKIAADFAGQQNNREIVLIISDILQTGKDKKQLYQNVAEIISKNNKITRVIGIGNDISDHSYFFEDKNVFFPDTESFIRSGLWSEITNKTILIKGARKYRFEKIVSQLELKVHQSRMEISLTSVSDNLKVFRNMIGDDVKMMVMVKAFSYGSGYIEISRHLQNQAVDYLGVAVADEGVEMRKAGIHLPVMVMNPQPGSFETMAEYHLEPEIYSPQILEILISSLSFVHHKVFNIHLKLDTGMHRLGICPHELNIVLKKIIENDKIKVKSVFSHLTASDIEKYDNFTQHQLDLYSEMYNKIVSELGYKPLRHIANTNAIIRFPQSRLDMVRLGIGLYGISSEKKSELKNVVALKSRVISLKNLKAGETVSYNRSGFLNRDSEIAVIPLGYADGLNRKLGNGNWQVEINGKNYSTIGDVCMDMTMIDVTGGNVKTGDDVVIFGDSLPVSDMANVLNTISYEILSGISRRVKRIYYYE